MKKIILTPEALSLDEHSFPLPRPPVVSSGVDKDWIYHYFTFPKIEAFAVAKARQMGYRSGYHSGMLGNRRAEGDRNDFFYFYHEGEGAYDSASHKIAVSKLREEIALPEFTKYLGIDLGASILNGSLKSQIDHLALNQLETFIIEKIVEGLSFRGGTLEVSGPTGVILAMTDLYSVEVKY